MSEAGISAIAVVPPYGDGRRVTVMPCRCASRATTNRPSWALSDGSNSGGFASRSLAARSASSVIPRPRSSTSIAKPLATACPLTRTGDCGGENVVAFSTTSASRWMTSATAEPSSATRGSGCTRTRG